MLICILVLDIQIDFPPPSLSSACSVACCIPSFLFFLIYIFLCQVTWFLSIILFFYFYFLTLQFCIGFAIYQHESATGIHAFPILNPPTLYHPSGSSQYTSPKHPVSCIKSGLVICFLYDIMHFNAILPNHPTLSLSHRVQKNVLYICVSFAILHTGLLLPSLQ